MSNPVPSGTPVNTKKTLKLYKDDYLNSLNSALGKEESLNKIIKLRENYIKSPSKHTVSSFYYSSKNRQKNTNAKKVYNNKLSIKLKNIDTKIMQIIANSKNKNQNEKHIITPNIEKKLYNIYKTDTEKKQKLSIALASANINRRVSKIHKNDKLFKGTRQYLGNIGRKMSNASTYIGRATGLSKSNSATDRKIKQLKTDIQILRKEKTKLEDEIGKIIENKNYIHINRSINNSVISKIGIIDKIIKKITIKENGIYNSNIGNYSEKLPLLLKNIDNSYKNLNLSSNPIINPTELPRIKEELIEKKKLLEMSYKFKKNSERIDEINKQIELKKKRIKDISKINYNENSETYENIMLLNSYKFDLDGEYNKLFMKKNVISTFPKNETITFYKNLSTKYTTINGEKNGVNLELNNNFGQLFNKDNKLFSKFTSSVPYSEYNFLYGIDKGSTLAEERLVALLYMSKIVFTFFIEPHYFLLTTVAIIGLLMSRFALDYYRKIKRTFEKKIVFCVKYYPFNGLEHFNSELIAKYHKIFYYEMDDANNNQLSKNDKNKEFYESVIELNKREEKDFIEKNILFIKYLDNYEKEKNNKLIKKINESVTKEVSNGIFKNISTQVNESTSNNGNRVKESISTENLTSNNGNQVKESITNSTKNQTSKINPSSEIRSNPSSQFGLVGGNLRVLKNDRNRDGKLSKPKLLNKKIIEQFSEINKATFRLNYKFKIGGKEYLLTSGDISIQNLFLELKPIINARATLFEGELKPLSKSIPFFTNDYLINLLDTIASESTKYATMESTRIYIIDFIKEYIDNFTKLYQLAKYNVLLLLEHNKFDGVSNNYRNKNLLLKELFNLNLSYTGIGRYKFLSNVPDEDELEQIKYRDILNYYCLLLKYCQIALDHVHKRFKISIDEFPEEIIEQNIQQNIQQNSQNKIVRNNIINITKYLSTMSIEKNEKIKQGMQLNLNLKISNLLSSLNKMNKMKKKIDPSIKYELYNLYEEILNKTFNDKLNIKGFKKSFSFLSRKQLNPYNITDDKHVKNIGHVIREMFSELSNLPSL